MSELERLDKAIAEWSFSYDSLEPVLDAASAYRDALANGQRVEWCETHDCQGTTGGRWCVCVGPSLDGETIDERAEQAAKYNCRIVSKLLSVYPKEAENE